MSFLVWVIIATIYATASAVQQLNVSGLVAAVFSPFDDSLKLNLTVVPEQAALLNATGVEYAFVAGTTGESVSLSQSERQQLLEAWISIAPTYNIKVIAHVGANCLEDSRQLAKHAVNLNSTSLVAFASMPTSFFKPVTIQALTELMRDIANAAPSLPFYYYHLPSMTGVEFSMYDFITYAGTYIPNLMGVKYTGLYYAQSGFADVLKLLNYKDKNGRTYEILTGRDEMLIQSLITGITGMVGSQYNFAGELYNNIIMEYNNGNINKARELMLYADNLLFSVNKNVTAGMNGIKYMMVEAGVDVGDSRLPYMKMDKKEKDMEEKNTVQWCDQTNDALSWCKDLKQRRTYK